MGQRLTIGDYELGHVLGKGGMARVWSGVHLARGQRVAIKVLAREVATSAEVVQTLRNEVRAVAALEHPHIITLFDQGEITPAEAAASEGQLIAGSPWLAMELAEGGTLTELRRPPWPRLKEILRQLLGALAHAHAHGVVHLDLKPDNVLLDAHGQVRLTDFGIAHAFDSVRIEARRAGGSSTPEQPSQVVGTPPFMAPEQFTGEWRDFGPWTDLYALGCMLWWVLTGHPPFRQTHFLKLAEAHFREMPGFLSLPPDHPPRLEGFIRRLLEKNPRNRWLHAADAAWALEQLEGADLYPLGAGEGEEEGDPVTLLMPAQAPLPSMSGNTTLLTPLTLPGRSAPPDRPPLPDSWREVASSPRPVPGPSLFGLRPPRLVGRDAESDQIWSELAQVHESGQGRIVIVQGAAGTGKTRLVDWIATRAAEVGAATVLRAIHNASGGPVTGLAPMFLRHLRLLGLPPDEASVRLLHALAQEGLEDLTERTALIELLTPAPEGLQTSSVQREDERLALLGGLLSRWSRQRPLLVVLDDVQWGPEALAFAHHLRQSWQQAPMPVLLVLTAQEEGLSERPSEAAQLDALSRTPGVSWMWLPPLTAEQHRALVASLLELEEGLVERVTQRTAGNPLFAVQLVADWVQRRLLVPGQKGWSLRGGKAALPDDLHQVWTRRVRRLLEPHPPFALYLLEIAATLGLSFDEGEWRAAAVAARLPWDDSLVDHLLSARLLTVVDPSPQAALTAGVAWSFIHAMLRESLLRTAAERSRTARWHRACAAMLATRAGQAGIAERRSHHLLAAGDNQIAMEPLLAAAWERYQGGDRPRAIQLCEHYLKVAEHLGHSPSERTWLLGLVPLSFLRLDSGDPASALSLAEQLERDGRQGGWPDLEGMGLLQRANCMRWKGRFAGTAPLYQRALPLLSDTRWKAYAVYCLRGLANCARELGDLRRSLELYATARERYRQLGERRAEVYTVVFMANEVRALGDPTRAELLLKEGVELARACGHVSGMAEACRGLGKIAMYDRHDLDAAERYLTQALKYHEHLSSYRLTAETLNELGEVARLRGDTRSAMALFQRSVHHHQLSQSPDSDCVLLNMSQLLSAQGEYARIVELLQDLPQQIIEAGRRRLLGSVRVALAVGEAGCGHLDRALELLELAMTTLSQPGTADRDDIAHLRSLHALLTRAGHPGVAQVEGALTTLAGAEEKVVY